MIEPLLDWLAAATVYGSAAIGVSKLFQTRRARSRSFRFLWSVGMTTLLLSVPFTECDVYGIAVVLLNAWPLSIALLAYGSVMVALLIPIRSSLACLEDLSRYYPWDSTEVFGLSQIVVFLVFHAWIWSILLSDLQHRDPLSLEIAPAPNDLAPSPMLDA